MLVSMEYRLIPYIRYNIALKYLLILSRNIEDNPELFDMLFKASSIKKTRAIIEVLFDKLLKELSNG